MNKKVNSVHFWEKVRICDGAPGNNPCPRKNPCEGDCHFNSAGTGVAVDIDKRWLDEVHSETALVIATWVFVAFVVGIMLGVILVTAYALLVLP